MEGRAAKTLHSGNQAPACLQVLELSYLLFLAEDDSGDGWGRTDS